MKLFSQREGIKPIKSILQVDSMDSELRNGLWDVLTICYWDRVKRSSIYGYMISNHEDMDLLFKRLWHNYFKSPIDTLIDFWPVTHKEIRKHFFNFKWNEVYDFIEFIANNYPDKHNSVNQNFMKGCNSVLERELSAYRFVGGKITQITSKEEIAGIEEALDASNPFKPVNNHLKSALDIFSDRKSPVYRNSIKESISAVEAICKLITGNPNATLGDALKEIERKSIVELHPALKNAFSSLYGYTSATGGIRHALVDEPNLDVEDARFMLVACSGFVSYLIAKSSKAGIEL